MCQELPSWTHVHQQCARNSQIGLPWINDVQGAPKLDSRGSTTFRKLSDDRSICINGLTLPILKIYVQPAALLGKLPQPILQTLVMELEFVCILYANIWPTKMELSLITNHKQAISQYTSISRQHITYTYNPTSIIYYTHNITNTNINKENF
jgi:hypothetical protein